MEGAEEGFNAEALRRREEGKKSNPESAEGAEVWLLPAGAGHFGLFASAGALNL